MRCTLILLGKDTYADPENSLSKLRDPKECVKRVERSLNSIQNLTPAYDCISVLGMMSHITGQPGQELCFVTTKDEATNERVRIVCAQPEHVVKQLERALQMLTTTTRTSTNTSSSSTEKDMTKVRFGRNVAVAEEEENKMRHEDSVEEDKKTINYRNQTRDAIRSVLLRKLLEQRAKSRQRIDPKTGEALMTAKEWRTKFGREIRSTQLYDQQMTRKNQLHSEILKHVKTLRHSPSWAKKSLDNSSSNGSRKPEFFMPPAVLN